MPLTTKLWSLVLGLGLEGQVLGHSLGAQALVNIPDMRLTL